MNPQQSKIIRIQSTFLLVFLAIQYAFGMYVNFYVTFPDGIQGGDAWRFAWTQFALAAHIVIGILLLLGAIVFLVRVLRYGSKKWKAPAIWGLVAIALAGTAGSLFLPSQTDFYSYIMALMFLLAFFSYAWGYFRADPGS